MYVGYFDCTSKQKLFMYIILYLQRGPKFVIYFTRAKFNLQNKIWLVTLMVEVWTICKYVIKKIIFANYFHLESNRKSFRWKGFQIRIHRCLSAYIFIYTGQQVWSLLYSFLWLMRKNFFFFNILQIISFIVERI